MNINNRTQFNGIRNEIQMKSFCLRLPGLIHGSERCKNMIGHDQFQRLTKTDPLLQFAEDLHRQVTSSVEVLTLASRPCATQGHAPNIHLIPKLASNESYIM